MVKEIALYVFVAFLCSATVWYCVAGRYTRVPIGGEERSYLQIDRITGTVEICTPPTPEGEKARLATVCRPKPTDRIR